MSARQPAGSYRLTTAIALGLFASEARDVAAHREREEISTTRWRRSTACRSIATGAGLVTIWVIVRDDRGGKSWVERQLAIQP